MIETAATETTPAQRLNAALARILSILERHRDERGLSPGDRAELRRMEPVAGVLPAVFWRLAVEPAVAAAIDDLARGDRETGERAFAVVVQAIVEAETAGQEPVGAALAPGLDRRGHKRKGYAEERVVRFLRARGPDLAHEARQVARWCGAEAGGVRFTDERGPNGLGPFLLHAFVDSERATKRAHAIARDYFRTLARAQSDVTEDTE